MSLWVLAPLVLLAFMLTACYLGSGLVLYPPDMSRMEAFPEQFGLRYERVAFKTRDGLTLKGWFMPSPKDPDEERTLLMCHGWGDNKGELLKITYFLAAEAGFNLFYFDNRSHGESQGDFTTMGFLELIDFDAAIGYLRENKPRCMDHLGVFGLSMGAAVASMAMPEHPEIKAAVFESPFTDFRRVMSQYAWNHFRVPYFPLMMMTFWVLRLRVGEPRIDAYSPIRFIGRIAPRPLLIVSGSEDSLMPESEVRELFAAAGEPKQLWIIPGAKHAKCRDAAGLEYDTRIAGFFRKNL